MVLLMRGVFMRLMWTYGHTIPQSFIDEMENYFEVKLPLLYKQIVLEHDKGRPSFNCFDMPDSQEKMFLGLLSLDRDDKYKTNVYSCDEALKSQGLDTWLVPFGIDPFGNFICFDYSHKAAEPEIVYCDHETGFEPSFVCGSFNEFLDILHD